MPPTFVSSNNQINKHAGMKTLKTTLAILLISIFAINSGYAQERTMPEIHSMMVYNFMKYVHWPPTSTNGDFVIGVVGDADVYATLTKWYGTKTKGSQKIVIKQFGSASDLSDCHVLYVGKSKSSAFASIKTAVAGKSTLIITDKSGLGKKGSGINFKTVNNKLKFELNQAAIASANLKVSSQLSGMAIMI